MPKKIDFNVPFLTTINEPVRRPKLDKNKMMYDEKGQQRLAAVLDENGVQVMEDVMLKDMLVSVLDAPFEGDHQMPFDERVKRGKLARKVYDSTNASLKNYSDEELALLKDLTGKIGATSLLLQLQEAIEKSETQAA